MAMTITDMKLALVRRPGISSSLHISGTDLEVGAIVKIQNAAKTRTWLGPVVKITTAKDKGIAVVQFLQPVAAEATDKPGEFTRGVEDLTVTVTSTGGTPTTPVTVPVEVYDIP